MSRLLSDNTIGQLLEAEQGQSTSIIDCSARIAPGNLLIDQGDQYCYSLVLEAHSQLNLFRTESTPSRNIHCQANSSQGRACRFSISLRHQTKLPTEPHFLLQPQCLIKYQWGERRPTLQRMMQEQNPIFW